MELSIAPIRPLARASAAAPTYMPPHWNALIGSTLTCIQIHRIRPAAGLSVIANFFLTTYRPSGCFMLPARKTHSPPLEFSHIPPPPPLGPLDADFVQFFEKNGLHPYDSMLASAIGRAAMNALAGCVTKPAGQTCVLYLPNLLRSQPSWHAVKL